MIFYFDFMMYTCSSGISTISWESSAIMASRSYKISLVYLSESFNVSLSVFLSSLQEIYGFWVSYFLFRYFKNIFFKKNMKSQSENVSVFYVY